MIDIFDKYGEYYIHLYKKQDQGEVFYLVDTGMITLEEFYQAFKDRYDREKDEEVERDLKDLRTRPNEASGG